MSASPPSTIAGSRAPRLVTVSSIPGDRHFARPVLAAEAGEAPFLTKRDDFAQRHFGSVRRAQEETLESGAVGASARIAHLDLDFLVAAREALGDRALERVSHLHPGALGGKAERPAARGHLEDELLLAVGKIVVERADARKAPQQVLDFRCRGLEIVRRPAPESDVDFAARRAAGPCIEVDLFDIGERRISARQASMNSSVRTGRSSEGTSSTVKPPY